MFSGPDGVVVAGSQVPVMGFWMSIVVMGCVSYIVPGRSISIQSAMHCPGFLMFVFVCAVIKFVFMVCPPAVDSAVAQCRVGERRAVAIAVMVFPLLR